MKWFRFLFMLLAVWLGMFQCLDVNAQEVVVNGHGISREAAMQDAFRQAVEQAVGTLVDSQTRVRNYAVLTDDVYTKSQGFIREYSILSEQYMDARIAIQVRIIVDSEPNSQLMTTLQRLQMIDVGLRDPRIAVIVTEHYNRPLPDPVAESAIVNQLIEAGFKRLTDPNRLAHIRRSDAIKAVINCGDTATAIRLAATEPLDYLIVGEAFSEHAGYAPGHSIISCYARVETRLIKADTGEIIAAQGFQSGGIDVTELAAAKASLNNAGKLAGKFFADKLMTYAANPEKGLRLKVVAVNDYAVINLLGRLVREQPGVSNVFLRDYQQGTAMFDVNYIGNPAILAERLEKMPELPVKVNEISHSVIVVSMR